MNNSGAIESIKNVAASAKNGYVQTNLKIDYTDDNTRNLISSTFSIIKNNIQSALMSAVGFDPNVSIAFLRTQSDPNSCIEIQGKKLYPHPGVGNMRAYNEMGNPSGGVFTMHTIA